ncbi:MAG TPA: SURF1 family cytochrome oxidase biogenesis protein, partial [Luteimonas sp.]|nr:SURF1 family cytochrome oxidase biogenesis protein [Luteimonas sp.]
GAVVVTGLDAADLPAALGVGSLPPRVLKLDPDLPLGFDRDLDVLPNTLSPEKHLGYAVQWFGLALAVLVTALVLTFRRPRR